MAVERLLPGEGADDPNTGTRWGLTDREFKRWWDALLPDDRSEFMDLYQGSMMEARLVCAIDYLVAVEGRAQTSDLIVRAYVLAAGMDDQRRHDVIVREQARLLWEAPGVTALLDRIRHRASRQAADRIERRLTAEIEKMFVEGEDDAKTRQQAVTAALQYTKNVAADRRVDHEIRQASAYRKMLEEGRARKVEPERLPTPQEASALLQMLRESYDEATFQSLIQPMLPAAPQESKNDEDTQ